jgi:hypothetical protein
MQDINAARTFGSQCPRISEPAAEKATTVANRHSN